MNTSIFSWLSVIVLICVNTLTVFAAESAPQPDAASLFPKPLKWTSSGILVSPISDETHTIVSVKDPTVVYWNGLWHIYATAYSTSARTWSMVYLNFKDWSEVPKAKLTYIDVNPDLRGYHCAPHLFYFTPHKKWYFIFQSQQPQYCSTDDISKPETWTKPQDFFDGKPEGTPRLWIDYHIICDDTHAYLFFTGDNGRFYRSRTKIEDFPNGFGDVDVAIQDNRNNLFEGSMTYKIKGTNTYMTMIEALSPARYYRIWISNDLNGQWTPVPGADSWETPFAGINNVTFEDGVEPWTRDISHGELLRDNFDETPTVDLNSLRFLFQGRDPNSGGNYSLLPYRLGLLTLESSLNESGGEQASQTKQQNSGIVIVPTLEKLVNTQPLQEKDFGGDKQLTMKLYENIMTNANLDGLVLNFHGTTLQRGFDVTSINSSHHRRN